MSMYGLTLVFVDFIFGNTIIWQIDVKDTFIFLDYLMTSFWFPSFNKNMVNQYSFPNPFPTQQAQAC